LQELVGEQKVCNAQNSENRQFLGMERGEAHGYLGSVMVERKYSVQFKSPGSRWLALLPIAPLCSAP
jgi:hypothetical protein